jgi:hypothetical protein
MTSTSTTLPEATEALYERFETEWISSPGVPRTPYALDNEEFDTPAGSNGKGAPWVRFSVRHGGASQETLGRAGNRKFARTGRAFIQLFVPPGTGRAVTDDLMEAARSMFEGRAIPGTTIRPNNVIVAELGEVEDGRWWASTCEAVFEYDQIK